MITFVAKILKEDFAGIRLNHGKNHFKTFVENWRQNLFVFYLKPSHNINIICTDLEWISQTKCEKYSPLTLSPQIKTCGSTLSKLYHTLKFKVHSFSLPPSTKVVWQFYPQKVLSKYLCLLALSPGQSNSYYSRRTITQEHY